MLLAMLILYGYIVRSEEDILSPIPVRRQRRPTLTILPTAR